MAAQENSKQSPLEEAQKLNIERLSKRLHSIKESAEKLETQILEIDGNIDGNGEMHMSDFKNKLVRTKDAVVTNTKKIAKRTDAYVTNNPWAAAGIFAGIGFLTGMIYTKRSH